MRVLYEANLIVRRKWGSLGKGWKALIILSVLGLLAIGLVVGFIWLLGRLVGRTRNLDLYYIRRR